MRFFPEILAPAAGLLLMIAEVWLICAGLFAPHVSGSYQDYFIRQTQSCWLSDAMVRQAEAALSTGHYRIAGLSANDACYLLQTGWSDLEPAGVWTDGRVALLHLPPTRETETLVLTVNAFAAHGDQTVVVRDAGRIVGSFAIPPYRISLFQIRLPASAPRGHILTIRIGRPASPFSIGDGNDTRLLGIQLIGLAWEPPGGEPPGGQPPGGQP